MKLSIRKSGISEDGTITADWVVLMAAVVGVLFGPLTVFADATMDHSVMSTQAMVSHTAG